MSPFAPANLRRCPRCPFNMQILHTGSGSGCKVKSYKPRLAIGSSNWPAPRLLSTCPSITLGRRCGLFGVRTRSLVLPRHLQEGVKALSRLEGTTEFMTLLAAFKVLLHRYTGQDDVIVGTPIANRNRLEIEGVIGCFVNALVLRTDLSGNPGFRELLRRVRKVCLGAYSHQDLPFDRLVEELQVKRDLNRNPLFQVMFVLHNTSLRTVEQSGLTLSPVEADSETAHFDLTLQIADTDQGLTAALVYNIDLFDATTIARMLENFQTLLAAVVADPEQRVADLPLLTETERQQLLVEWNSSRTDCPPDVCIHQLFEAQVERTPDAIAVVFEAEQLTYGELNRRANQLAHYLRALGVGPEVLVAICLERSLKMVIGLLGILKAGGAYVPLDPAYPQAAPGLHAERCAGAGAVDPGAVGGGVGGTGCQDHLSGFRLEDDCP